MEEIMRKYKAPLKNRTTYVYRYDDGTPIMELRPGENGVTEADIQMLHRADDDEWNNDYMQRQIRRDFGFRVNLKPPVHRRFCLLEQSEKESATSSSNPHNRRI
jgi:hypothetical protein